MMDRQQTNGPMLRRESGSPRLIHPSWSASLTAGGLELDDMGDTIRSDNSGRKKEDKEEDESTEWTMSRMDRAAAHMGCEKCRQTPSWPFRTDKPMGCDATHHMHATGSDRQSCLPPRDRPVTDVGDGPIRRRAHHPSSAPLFLRPPVPSRSQEVSHHPPGPFRLRVWRYLSGANRKQRTAKKELRESRKIQSTLRGRPYHNG